jgi:hypothetical protein
MDNLPKRAWPNWVVSWILLRWTIEFGWESSTGENTTWDGIHDLPPHFKSEYSISQLKSLPLHGILCHFKQTHIIKTILFTLNLRSCHFLRCFLTKTVAPPFCGLLNLLEECKSQCF